MAVVRIEVELDDRGAVVRTRQLGDEFGKLPAKTAPATRATNELRRAQWEASNAAQILAMRLGVTLPEGVRKFLAESKKIGPILTSAFNVTVYAAMGAALIQLISNFDDVVASVTDWDGSMARAKERTKELNDAIDSHLEKIIQLRHEYDLIGKSGSSLANAMLSQISGQIARGQETLAFYEQQLLEAKKRATEIQGAIAVGYGGTALQPTAGARLAREQIVFIEGEIERERAALEELYQKAFNAHAKWNEAVSEETSKRLEETRKRADEIQAQISKNFDQLNQAVLDELEMAEKLRAERKKLLDESAEAQKEIDALGIARLRKSTGTDVTEENIAAGIEKQAARAKEIIAKYKRDTEEIAEKARQNFERIASSIESFFDRVFLTARSWADVFRQLWTQTISFVVKQIARMVAAWWMGQRAMSQATATGGMGTNPAGAVASLAAAPMMMGAGGGNAGGGWGFSGGGPGVPVMLPGFGASGTGGIGSTGSGAVRSGIFGGMGMTGLAIAGAGLGGSLLAGYGIRGGNPIIGGLGGAVLGGALGVGASYMLAGTGSMWAASLALWAPVIGVAAGAILGTLLAMRNRGKQKRASAQVHEQYLAAQKKIIEEFERHRTSYDSAVGSLGVAYESAVQALQGMGGPGRNTISEIGGKYQAALARLEQLQKSRDYRTQTIAGLPVPSFASGSYGILGVGSGFLAQLHPGEAVLNRRAAQRLGDRGIEALNSGGAVPGSGGLTVNIYAQDAQTSYEWMRRNRGSMVRVLRQAARDAGLPVPV